MTSTNIDRAIDRTKVVPPPKNRGHWLVGVLVATLLFALLYWLGGFQYLGNDDAPILRSFMGYEGGVPASYHLFVHTAFAWLLHGLAVLAPGVAWFSILQLFLLWFSCVVIVKSMAQCATNHGRSLWLGTLCAVFFLLVYAAFVISRLSYTTTAGLLGAAAVSQLMGIPYQKGTNRQIYRSILLSILLLVCCYCLRAVCVVPSAAFALLAVGLAWLQYFVPRSKKKQTTSNTLPSDESTHPSRTHGRAARSAKPLLLGLLTGALLFGALLGTRLIESKALHLEEYLQWHSVRTDLFDYTGFVYDTNPDDIPSFGWTFNEFYLFGQWFFMDGNITTEAMEKIYALQPTHSTPTEQMEVGLRTVADFFAAYPAYAYGCALLVLLMLVCLVLAIRGRRGVLALGAVAGLLLALAMVAYLCLRGRFPLRAATSVIFPLGTFLFPLWLATLGQASMRRQKSRSFASRLTRFITLLVCIVLGASACIITTRELTHETDPETLARITEIPITLDSYGLENPDILIIYDITCVHDNRLFPDTSEGIPTNVMFWGGWPARSPSWLYQLEQFGIDGNHMTAEDFLREDVVVASAVGKPYPALHQYLIESLETDIDWDFYGEDGYISYFRFYEQ